MALLPSRETQGEAFWIPKAGQVAPGPTVPCVSGYAVTIAD